MINLLEWEGKQMEQYGWFAHYVPGSPDYPNRINYHTHGVPESFGHLDLQICFPIQPAHAHSLFTIVINQIKEGKVFIEDKPYHKVLAKYPLTFALAFEGGRNVLRLLLPDEQGKLEAPLYNQQNDMLSDNSTPIVWD